jgi:hypothetical protein
MPVIGLGDVGVEAGHDGRPLDALLSCLGERLHRSGTIDLVRILLPKLLEEVRRPAGGNERDFARSFLLWFLIYGLWFLIYGLWFLIYGLWLLVSGLWPLGFIPIANRRVIRGVNPPLTSPSTFDFSLGLPPLCPLALSLSAFSWSRRIRRE